MSFIEKICGKYALEFGDRQFAFLTDLFFLGFIYYFVGLVFNFNFETTEGALANFIFILFLLLWFLYFCGVQYKFGTTLGKYLFDLKIIDEKTNNKPSFVRLVAREVLFLTVFTGIGFIFFYLPKGYYWDRVTKTKVVPTKEKEINLNSITNFIKSHKTFLLVILLAVVAGLWFYWFEWKPMQIRKECAEKYNSINEVYYNQCIRSRGLEK